MATNCTRAMAHNGHVKHSLKGGIKFRTTDTQIPRTGRVVWSPDVLGYRFGSQRLSKPGGPNGSKVGPWSTLGDNVADLWLRASTKT